LVANDGLEPPEHGVGDQTSGPQHPRVAVVVGNPRPGSRTLAAARLLAGLLTPVEPDPVVDLAGLGGRLLDPHDPEVVGSVRAVGEADLVVVASPTYKASFTGLLKLFLDRFPPGGLPGVAVPLMLGAGPGHALAPEAFLRPVLIELGAAVPVRGLYVLDSAHDDPTAYAGWLERARPVISSLLPSPTPTGVPA
jgi:FMN reductase